MIALTSTDETLTRIFQAFLFSLNSLILMVPAEGFEPPTFGLQNRCTTTVLSRLKGKTRTRFGLEHRSPQGCGSYVRFQLAASTHMIVQSRRAFVSATQP